MQFTRGFYPDSDQFEGHNVDGILEGHWDSLVRYTEELTIIGDIHFAKFESIGLHLCTIMSFWRMKQSCLQDKTRYSGASHHSANNLVQSADGLRHH